MTPYRTHEMKVLEDQWLHAQPMRVECSLCSWSTEGATGEVLQAQIAHRTAHGISKRRKGRMPAALLRFRQPNLSEDELDEIERERRRRALLTGVELDD